MKGQEVVSGIIPQNTPLDCQFHDNRLAPHLYEWGCVHEHLSRAYVCNDCAVDIIAGEKWQCIKCYEAGCFTCIIYPTLVTEVKIVDIVSPYPEEL